MPPAASPSPPRPPADGRPALDVRARRARAKARAAANGAGRAAAAQASAASIGLFQRFVVRDPQEPRRRRQTTTAIAGSGAGQAPARQARNFPAGPGSPPGRLRWNASRKAASSSVRPARRTLAAAALSARRRRKTPAQGGFSPDDRVEAGKRRAGEKGGFGFRFGRIDRPRPGRERRRRGGRKALDCLRITAREHAETLRRDGAFA